ncbi:hypothetical protein [Indioceanicola profundi]|uniref:hypothetical protein n=1 Tax=Indioceanicola profundi TaxID=2220096 RepID=UPI000E6AC683|nr:hypothetical protein [Indioceanicola profundi]
MRVADGGQKLPPLAAGVASVAWPRTPLDFRPMDMPPAQQPRPLSVFDLSPAEQLLLWSARRWRHGRHRWQEVEAEFRRHLGARWSDALLPWDMALDLLHRLPLGQPDIQNGCVTALSGDEAALIRLVSLLQQGKTASTGLLLARLARPYDREELLEWLDLTAAALPPLPLRAVRPCAGAAAVRPILPDC